MLHKCVGPLLTERDSEVQHHKACPRSHPLLPNEVVQSRTPVTVPCAALCPLAIQTAHVCIHCTKHREIGHAKLPFRGSYSSWVDNENTPYNSDLTVNKQTKNSE